jgi:hypothetical protein
MQFVNGQSLGDEDNEDERYHHQVPITDTRAYGDWIRRGLDIAAHC